MAPSSRPEVEALVRAKDLEGLRAAAEYEDRLNDRDGSVVDAGAAIREQAVLALGELTAPEVPEEVVDALADPSDRVRLAAVRVCARSGDAGLLATAVASIPPGDGDARVLAITELLTSGEVGTSRLLAEALVYRVGPSMIGEEDLLLLDTALDSEGRAEAPLEVVDTLIGALADESEDIAARAEALLAQLAPASVEPLLEVLAGGAAPSRAASALGRIRDVRALGPLSEALERPDAELRAACCAALGELRDPAAVEVLLRAARDPEPAVRAQAGSALDRLGTLAVVVGVSSLLRTELAKPPPSRPRWELGTRSGGPRSATRRATTPP